MLLAFFVSVEAEEEFVIEDIRVEGLQRITPETVFNYLPMKVILSIVDKFLTKLQAQLDARNVELIYSNKVLNWIADNGFNKEMGARPMERFITNNIKKPLVDKVLFGELSKGGVIKVDLVKNSVKFSAKKKSIKSKV